MERFTPAVRHSLSKSRKISYNYLNYTILLSNRQSSKRHSLSFSFGENIERGWATIVAHPLSRLRVVSGGKGFPYSPPLWRAAARSRPPYHGRIRISIRTIHADGDLTLAGGVIITFAFQPTPSLWLVTGVVDQELGVHAISTRTILVDGDRQRPANGDDHH